MHYSAENYEEFARLIGIYMWDCRDRSVASKGFAIMIKQLMNWEKRDGRPWVLIAEDAVRQYEEAHDEVYLEFNDYDMSWRWYDNIQEAEWVYNLGNKRWNSPAGQRMAEWMRIRHPGWTPPKERSVRVQPPQPIKIKRAA